MSKALLLRPPPLRGRSLSSSPLRLQPAALPVTGTRVPKGVPWDPPVDLEGCVHPAADFGSIVWLRFAVKAGGRLARLVSLVFRVCRFLDEIRSV